MVGLLSWEVYNSIYYITEENNKFRFYTDPFDDFSFKELKKELEEIPGIPDYSPEHLEGKTIGQRFIGLIEKYHEKSDRMVVFTC